MLLISRLCARLRQNETGGQKADDRMVIAGAADSKDRFSDG
ncbi:hypothetical protein FRUB_09654 [Fimbriiglobus ruber]|uniref:Uncharacterized protein n=1 Tax=Fimbriiglobus ruber TaxID=1908690 RepID=A0A225CZY4_9BACT|nr:hypothetical protein FRUB_09654 [Fimbriiglobus ruber]